MRSIRVVLALVLLSVFAFSHYSVSDNVCAQSCVPPPPNLVAWWTGDGDTHDLAGENDGTLEGGTTFASGIVGEAFSFDGVDDYVNVPDDESLNPVDGLTVDAWIKRSGYVGVCDPIVKKAGEGLSQENGYALEFIAGDSLVFWVFLQDVGWKSSGWAPPIPLGVWTHVAGTYDGSDIRLYVNGAEADSPITYPGTIVPSSNPLYLGHDPSNPDRWYEGLIDEVEVFDRALSDVEIQAIYLAGSAGKCKALLVDIDIKPGSYPNSFNLNGNGVVPVAILGSDSFDVAEIDDSTLSFAGMDVRVKGNGSPQCSVADVSGSNVPYGEPDGYSDLVCQFVDDPATWSPDNGIATVTGSLNDGTPFEGSDTINLVP
jgi:hypothetical protein